MRVAFWEALLESTRTKTYAEWVELFDTELDVWAEVFRHNSELLHHPQIEHDGCTVVIDDPVVGKVVQPGAIVRMQRTPAELGTPAPALDEHGEVLRAEIAASSR